MNLKAMRAAALKAANDIIAKAKAEDRDLTPEEVTEIEAKSAEIKELDEKIAAQAKGKALLDSFATLGPDEPEGDTPAAKSLGEFAAKAIGEQMRNARGSKFTLTTPEFKAASDTHTVASSLAPAVTTVDTNLVTGVRRRLTVRDLLGAETISGSAITYFVEGALEGDFTTVAEGATKPQLHYEDPTAVTESLKKIAAFIKESDEIMEDLPWYVSAINSRLLYNLGLFEENQLLSGNGTGTNILGLLNRVGVQTEAGETTADHADAIFRAITKVSTGSGLDADGIVINPTDYQRLRLTKDGNGQYFGGGFFSGQYGQGGIIEQPPLWGLRTVVTPAIAAGTVLVGAFAQAASVVQKGGVRVESTNTDGTDFINNRITIRAEERVALAARRPAGFVKVTLTDA